MSVLLEFGSGLSSKVHMSEVFIHSVTLFGDGGNGKGETQWQNWKGIPQEGQGERFALQGAISVMCCLQPHT